jgi:hypothetical protein
MRRLLGLKRATRVARYPSVELEHDPALVLRRDRTAVLSSRLILPTAHSFHRSAIEHMTWFGIDHLHVVDVAFGRDGEAHLHPAFLIGTHCRHRVTRSNVANQHRTMRCSPTGGLAGHRRGGCLRLACGLSLLLLGGARLRSSLLLFRERLLLCF